MNYEDFKTIDIRTDEGVAWVTLNHPPLNVLDTELSADLASFASFARTVATDEAVRVIVLQSANKDFFAANADMNWMLDGSSLMGLVDPDGDPGLNPLQQLNERLRTLPQITIAKLRGRLRAGEPNWP